MKRDRLAAHRSRWLFCVSFITIVAIRLPATSAFQGASTTSRIKKPLIYQVGNVVRINAEGPRPLLRALDALQEKYGWMVAYEDPQYPADLDLSTNPDPFPRRRHANVRDSMESGFSVEFNVSSSGGPPDEKSVLTIVVDRYNQSNAAGQFELREERNGHFDAVGTGVRDQHGEVSSQQPILDLLITLTKGHRSPDRTIALICHKVSEQSKVPVTLSVTADSFGGRKAVAMGATQVSARTLLSRTLALMGDRLSWRLLYDSSGKTYELSLTRLAHSEQATR